MDVNQVTNSLEAFDWTLMRARIWLCGERHHHHAEPWPNNMSAPAFAHAMDLLIQTAEQQTGKTRQSDSQSVTSGKHTCRLGEGAQHHQVGVLPHPVQLGRDVAELNVRLVKHHQHRQRQDLLHLRTHMIVR